MSELSEWHYNCMPTGPLHDGLADASGEREHLRDEQVHDVGFDAGTVLQGSGHLVGEACAGLGVAARTVLDLCVGVTHDLLEHDVDMGAAT